MLGFGSRSPNRYECVVGYTEHSRPTLALLAETTVPGLSVRLGLSKPRINQYPEQFVSFHILDQIHG
jgi:hypothetical protein